MNWGLVFQTTLALITILSGIYATRAAVRGAKAEAEQKRIDAANNAEGADRKQNFEEMKASLQAARDDNGYLKKEAADARTEKARVETEAREREARIRQDYREQLDQERNGCREAVETFSRRLTAQLDPVLPPDLKKRLTDTLASLHAELWDNHFAADEFDRREPRGNEQ